MTDADGVKVATVEVCPECDIAGCRHIREKAADAFLEAVAEAEAAVWREAAEMARARAENLEKASREAEDDGMDFTAYALAEQAKAALRLAALYESKAGEG